MGGFCKRIGVFAMFAVAFGLPNLARAQAPPPAERLPWQTGQVFTQGAIPFGDSWARLLSDLRAFAALQRYATPPPISPAAQTDADAAIWSTDFRTYIPPSPEQPTIYVGAARVTLMPVQLTPTIVAESQTIQSVLVGLQFELPEIAGE